MATINNQEEKYILVVKTDDGIVRFKTHIKGFGLIENEMTYDTLLCRGKEYATLKRAQEVENKLWEQGLFNRKVVGTDIYSISYLIKHRDEIIRMK